MSDPYVTSILQRILQIQKDNKRLLEAQVELLKEISDNIYNCWGTLLSVRDYDMITANYFQEIIEQLQTLQAYLKEEKGEIKDGKSV